MSLSGLKLKAGPASPRPRGRARHPPPSCEERHSNWHPPAVSSPALRPPAHRVSRVAIRYGAARALGVWLVVAAAQVAWWIAAGGHTGLRVAALAATVAVAAAHAIVMPQWRYRVHRWEVAPQAVYTRAGWLRQESRIAPISRIQTVDSERGPLEQIFGLRSEEHTSELQSLRHLV